MFAVLALFLLSQSLLEHSLLKGLAPCTLLPGLTWVTPPYTFSKLGMSSSVSPCRKSSPIVIIRESSMEILKNHGHILHGIFVEQRGGRGDLLLCLFQYAHISYWEHQHPQCKEKGSDL